MSRFFVYFSNALVAADAVDAIVINRDDSGAVKPGCGIMVGGLHLRLEESAEVVAERLEIELQRMDDEVQARSEQRMNETLAAMAAQIAAMPSVAPIIGEPLKAPAEPVTIAGT